MRMAAKEHTHLSSITVETDFLYFDDGTYSDRIDFFNRLDLNHKSLDFGSSNLKKTVVLEAKEHTINAVIGKTDDFYFDDGTYSYRT